MKLVLTYFILLCASMTFGQATTLKYKGGTYSIGESYGEGLHASVKVRPINAEKALFAIIVHQGEPYHNRGSISGVMKLKGTVGVFEKNDNDVMDIKLQFEFKADQLTVSTLDGRKGYGYGFGEDGLHPNYVYTLTNKVVPEEYISSDALLRPFIEAYVSMIHADYYYTPNDNDLWSSGNVKSGFTIAENQKWYKNDSLNQVTVAADYGDNEYSVWLHFYKDRIPSDLIDRMQLTNEDGQQATLDQKKKDITGFVDQAVNTSGPEFFESVQGVRLGDPKLKAIWMYGDPDQTTEVDGCERLIWVFVGENDFDPEVDAPDTKLVAYSYGQTIIQYYEDGKLIAQMLQDTQP